MNWSSRSMNAHNQETQQESCAKADRWENNRLKPARNEMHQLQLLKTSQSQQSIVRYEVSRKHAVNLIPSFSWGILSREAFRPIVRVRIFDEL